MSKDCGSIVGMPPHKYEQAKERARDDLGRQELANILCDLPCVAELLVDGEDEDWREAGRSVSGVRPSGRWRVRPLR